MEFVFFNQRDEPVGISRIRGVPTGLQALRPALVVGGLQLKQPRVPVPQQKVAVVLVAVLRVVVHAEAFAFLVVVVVGALAGPRRVALDAKVVVGPLRQLTHPVAAFQDALGQRDARRDAVLLHLAHSFILPLVDVRLVRRHRLGTLLVPLWIARRNCPCGPWRGHQAGVHEQDHTQSHHGSKGLGSGGCVRSHHGASFLNVQATFPVRAPAPISLKLLLSPL